MCFFQLFIDPGKLLPLSRFLPKPAQPKGPKKKGAGGAGRGGFGGRGGARGGFGGRGGGGMNHLRLLCGCDANISVEKLFRGL